MIKDVVCRRIWKAYGRKGKLKLRFIMDRQSIELFVNDGEQVVQLQSAHRWRQMRLCSHVMEKRK